MTNTAAPYQLLPDLGADEYAALRDDIADHGYDPAHPVVVDAAGNILDGHHRARACAELGVDYPTVVRADLDEPGKHEYTLRANLARRHLSSAQKRELVARLLVADPDRSDRALARLVGCDHKTVGAVRRGENPQPDERLRDLLAAQAEARERQIEAEARERQAQWARERQIEAEARERQIEAESRERNERELRTDPAVVPYPVHPALALIPPMTSYERRGLFASIQAVGLLEPITMHQGEILDGRERLYACRVKGVEPRFTEYTGDDPRAYVWSMNVYRMHLSWEQQEERHAAFKEYQARVEVALKRAHRIRAGLTAIVDLGELDQIEAILRVMKAPETVPADVVERLDQLEAQYRRGADGKATT